MKIELLQLAAKRIGITVEDAEKNCTELPEQNALYVWNPARGGKAIIIDNNGEMLGATSAVSFEKHLQAFISGKRS